VVHAHWAIPAAPAAAAAARRLGVPCFITLHGGDVYVNPEQGYDFPTRPYVRPVLRWTLRSAEGLTAISEDCRQHALRAGARDADAPDLERRISGASALTRSRPETVRSAHGLRVPAALPRKGIRLIEAGRAA
jgi:hypothetical protein